MGICIDKRQPSWICFWFFCFFLTSLFFSFCSIGVESTGIANDKTSKSCVRKEDTVAQQEKASKSANVKSTPSTSSNRNNGEARVGAFTRSRIVKKPRRDFSPPESPVKKQSQCRTKNFWIVSEIYLWFIWICFTLLVNQ